MVFHFNHGITIHLKYVKEELVILIIIEQIVTADIDFATYCWIYNNGFIEVFTDNINKFLNVSALKIGGILFRPSTWCCYHRSSHQHSSNNLMSDPFIIHSTQSSNAKLFWQTKHDFDQLPFTLNHDSHFGELRQLCHHF